MEAARRLLHAAGERALSAAQRGYLGGWGFELAGGS